MFVINILNIYILYCIAYLYYFLCIILGYIIFNLYYIIYYYTKHYILLCYIFLYIYIYYYLGSRWCSGWLGLSVCSLLVACCGFSPGSSASSHNPKTCRLTGDSKLPVGVNVSVSGLSVSACRRCDCQLDNG